MLIEQTGAIVIGDVIQEGQTVQFQVRDAHSADEDLHALLAAPPRGVPSKPLGALLFSCCGRGKGLFGVAHHDASVLGEQLGAIPLAGFFAQGEVGTGGRAEFSPWLYSQHCHFLGTRQMTSDRAQPLSAPPVLLRDSG
ncbi:MAG: FIST C-terminal domain-containing protein [Nitrospira sp.]